MIAASDLGFSIGPARLLHGISLRLQPGTITAVVGPNGAGKSTLLSLLAGSRQPSVGTVYWGEKPLRSLAPEQLARQRAVMTQGDDLVFPFLVEEVVLMARHPHNRGWADAYDREIAGRALHVCGAEHLQGRIYSQCSGGERQRIQLARALAQIWQPVHHGDGARVLLLDEPTSALDLAHQHACLQIVRRFADQGVAVLTVLHHLDLAATYADHMLLLHRGCCAAAGSVAAIMRPEVLSPVYGIELTCGQDQAGYWWLHALPDHQQAQHVDDILNAGWIEDHSLTTGPSIGRP